MIGEPLIFRLEGAGHSEMGDNSMGYRATNVSAERDGSQRGIGAFYLTALLISSQNAPTAAPAAIGFHMAPEHSGFIGGISKVYRGTQDNAE
jgi:hypothetical protein